MAIHMSRILNHEKTLPAGEFPVPNFCVMPVMPV